MAMAAVRFAARRLTGQQQQQQAILRSALANEQRVLSRGGALRRFTSSSEASAASGPKISTERPSVSGDSRLIATHQKKEALFDLLAELQMDKDIPYTVRMKDRRLLQHLTYHVRRPSSPGWRWYVREYRINNCLRGAATFLASLYMYEKWGSFFEPNKQVQGADSNSKASVSCAETNVEE